MLYDQFNRPIDLSALREERAGAQTMGVRKPWGEHPSEGLTPVRLASLLRESEIGDPAQYLALAEDMEEKDLHYQSVLGTRKRAVAQLKITVEPADDSADAEADAVLVREFVQREVLQDELFDILDAIGKGISITEIMWETSEKQWMPVELRWVDPRYIDFDRTDRRTPLLKTADGLKPLDPFKFVRAEIKAKSGLPIRGGIARGAAWAYLFKNFDIKSWVQFAEVYGQPIRVGKYGPDATEEDRRTLLRAVANIGTDAAAIIPESMMMEFIKADQKNSADMYEKLASFMERQQSKAVLGQTTTTDAISGGHAVSKEHNEVREDIEKADANQVGAILKRDIVKPLIDLNRGPRRAYPSIKIGRAEQIDQGKFAENVERLSRTGMRLSISQIYETMGLRAPDTDEDTLPPSTAAAAPDARSAPATARAKDTPETVDQIQELIAELSASDEFDDIMTPLIGPMEDLLASASSYQEFTDGLAARLKDMDLVAAAEAIAKSRFAARLAGEAGADIGNDE